MYLDIEIGIELKVGIEIEIETELEVGIEIDMIRYRGKTSSPAIIAATAAIISLLRQAPELASFLRAMARTKANPHPRRPFRPNQTTSAVAAHNVYKVVQL